MSTFKESLFPLQYSSIKNSSQINSFFGKFLKSHVVSNLEQYRKIIDIVNGIVYDHPYITSNGFTAPAQYFLTGGKKLSFSKISSEISGQTYVNLDTVDGNYLIVVKPEDMTDDVKLAAKIYNLIGKNTDACAIRSVIPSDRQVHWVWFRKSPTYKLTEEIILRAASWIELNPGYTFHLWTNLKDSAELEDFLSDLSFPVRDRYFKGTITVHYEPEFHDCVFSWLQNNIPELVQLFTEIWNSKERHNIVMKTDYSRNILLATHGGIYTDFNDLLCLTSIEPVLETHAGRCIGVTDNTSLQNTSNYFMYAGEGCPEWLDLTIRCTKTMPSVYAMIYDNYALETALSATKDMSDGKMPDLAAIQKSIDTSFPYNLNPKHFVFAIAYGIAHNISEPELLKEIQLLVVRGMMKNDYIQKIITIFKKHSQTIKDFAESKDFGIAWRFGRTDMYLSTIMHRCNLPIFAREQKTPITLLPFGYLLRYSNMISFVGHLGDGSSFGRDAKISMTIKKLLGVGV